MLGILRTVHQPCLGLSVPVLRQVLEAYSTGGQQTSHRDLCEDDQKKPHQMDLSFLYPKRHSRLGSDLRHEQMIIALPPQLAYPMVLTTHLSHPLKASCRKQLTEPPEHLVEGEQCLVQPSAQREQDNEDMGKGLHIHG